MADTRWICTGTCGVVLTEEEYLQSIKKCGTPGCDHEGKPFIKVRVCSVCGAIIRPGEKHGHAA